MNLILYSSEYGEIICSPRESLTPNDDGSLLFEATGDFGIIQIWEIYSQDYRIRHSTYKFTRNTSLWMKPDIPAPKLHYVTKNDVHYKVAGFASGITRLNQFSFAYTPNIPKEYIFKKDVEYVISDVHLTTASLEKWAAGYPFLRSFLYKVVQKEPALIHQPYRRISPEMLLLIRDITHIKHNLQHKEKQRHSNIIKLLKLTLKLADNKREKSSTSYREREIGIFQQTMEYLLTHLDNPGTIKNIAGKMLINEFKLKKGFKQLFKTSIHRFIIDERMNKAIILIQDTNTAIQDIAMSLGYKDASAFVNYFRKRFGFSPGSLRK